MANPNCSSVGKYPVKSGMREPVAFGIEFLGANGDDPATDTIVDPCKILDQSLDAPVERVSEGLYRLHLRYDCAKVFATANVQSATVGDIAQVADTDLTQGSNHIDVRCELQSTATQTLDDMAGIAIQVVGLLVPSL